MTLEEWLESLRGQTFLASLTLSDTDGNVIAVSPAAAVRLGDTISFTVDLTDS